MRVLLSIIFSFFAFTGFSQSGTKVLVIDTVVGDVSNFVITIVHRYDSTPWDDHRSGIHPKVDINRCPALTETFENESPSSWLQLPLDDSGGYIILRNTFSIPSDTIRIQKLTIFHNCFPDTVKYWKGWYKRFPSDTSGRLKFLKSNSHVGSIILKECKMVYPKNISITVNNLKYKADMQIISESPSKWYHGHKIKNERRYYRRLSSKKPYKYFAATETLVHYIIKARIELKQ